MPHFEIENGILHGCDSAEAELVIPDGVVTIGYDAFRENEDIIRVVIPDSVMIISQGAFASCKNLREIELPTSLIFIGDWAFCYCESLENMTVPDSVTYLGAQAFLNCTSLINITFPQHIEKLEDGVLCGCESLPRFDIPNSVRVIGQDAFIRCRSFVSVDIPFGVDVIGSSAFSLCSSLRYVNIPDSVHVIESMAFYDCNELESVRLPSTVFQTHYNAFPDTTRYSMRRFGFIRECEPNDQSLLPTPVPQFEIMNARALGFDINIHGSLQGYSGSESRVTIPSFVRSIAEEAFSWNQTIEKVTIPLSVEHIGHHAFAHCGNLRKVVFECKNPRMQRSVFYQCSSLQYVKLPEEIDEIPEAMFWGCSSLKSIDLPDKLRIISNDAFFDCSSLESIVLPNNLLSVNLEAFSSCSGLRSITFPASICNLGYRAFEKCPELDMVSIPSRLFIHEERLKPFDDGVRIDTFKSHWTPEPRTRARENAYRNNPQVAAGYRNEAEVRGVEQAKPSEYSSLMKTVTFVAQAASGAGEFIRNKGLDDMERIVSDVEYELDACGQMLFAVISDRGMPFLQPGAHAHGAAVDEQPFSYKEYKRGFVDNAHIPHDAKIGDVVKLLNTHLGTAFQEAVVAFQYALSTDKSNIELFRGLGRLGDGLIWRIAYAKSHFMSKYISLVSPTTLMLIPSEGYEFADAGPISLCDMKINEVVKCMMPGDMDRMMNVDARETPIIAYTTVNIAYSDYTAVPAGSKEVDDYIRDSISAWLENVR